MESTTHKDVLPSGPREKLLMDAIRGTSAHEQFSKLLDRSFGVKEGAHYLDDFPIWNERLFSGPSRALRVGIWEGTELASCAGVRLAKLKVPRGTVSVALIGAVATAERFRGRGFASRLVNTAVQWAQERGAAAAILWGSEEELYSKLGFELCGMQVRAPLAKLDLSTPRDFSSITLGRGWIPSLMEVLKNRKAGLQIEDTDDSWLSAHRNVEWYWLGEPSRPKAYAAIDRGIDLKGIIHEWGGDDANSIKTLLSLVQMERPDAVLLSHPQALTEYKLGQPMFEIEYLCMARPLNPLALLTSYGLSDQIPQDVLDSLGARTIFGPSEDALPLWLWGLDAV